MRILWLHLENFKCYSRAHIPEDGILPEGLIRIDGLNSSGKSTLFDAIYYVLFYDPGKKYIGKKDDLIRHGAGETLVELAFEVDSHCYVVQRKHGKKLSVQAQLVELDREFAMRGESKPVKIICSGLVEVNNKISELLNITSEKAVKTLIVRQGEIEQLAEARGAELRDLIYNLFELDYYIDRSNEVIKRRKEELEDEYNRYKIQITTEKATEMIAKHQKTIDEIERAINLARKEVKELSQALSEYPSIENLNQIKRTITQHDTMSRQRDSNEKNLLQSAQKLGISVPINEQSIKDAMKKIDKDTEEIDKKIEDTNKEIQSIIAEVSQIESELKKLKKRKESLENVAQKEGEKAICEVCEQEIEGEYLTSLIERTNKSIPELERKKEELKREKTRKESLIHKLNHIKQQHQSKKVAIKSFKQQYEQLQKLKKDSEEKKVELLKLLQTFKVDSPKKLAEKYGVKEFDDLYRKIQLLLQSKTQKETEIKQRNLQKINIMKQIKELEEIINENEIKEKKQEEIRQKIDLLNQVYDYVKGFIADDLITYRLLPGIQETTSDYIYMFTTGRYSEVYLEPTKQKTLLMTIKDSQMDFVKSQQLLSGGDRAAIGLAMRIGISTLLKRIRPMKNSPYQPPKMDILILDEPLGSLDSTRREKVLEGLIAEKRFSQIFLITHTSISQKIRSPTLRVQFSTVGSTVTYIPPPTEIEAEAEG